MMKRQTHFYFKIFETLHSKLEIEDNQTYGIS